VGGITPEQSKRKKNVTKLEMARADVGVNVNEVLFGAAALVKCTIEQAGNLLVDSKRSC
jgi:hypothetical protein